MPVRKKENQSAEEKKRTLFCSCYVILGDAEEAAVRAGYPKGNALSAAFECLRDSSCQSLIAELKNLLSGGDTAKTGLRRLAFGSCRDAVKLAFMEEMPSEKFLDTLDLYNVSEIKRVKGGGVEIRLFDRLKALEKLCEMENDSGSRDMAAGLMAALTASADREENEENEA
ncbi:MAG: terminase small subunit [Ruminococcus sp.]|nr:terminase small subunit [Ruminococcus sp.]